MSRHLFVYGTLKAGFPNEHVNHGVRVPGDFQTCERFPLYVIGAHHLPWMVNTPGQGEQVTGQLYEVTDADVARMDVLERIEEAGWYSRVPIQVRPKGDPLAPPIACEVYLGGPERVVVEGVLWGPLGEYTVDLSVGYVESDAHPVVAVARA